MLVDCVFIVIVLATSKCHLVTAKISLNQGERFTKRSVVTGLDQKNTGAESVDTSEHTRHSGHMLDKSGQNLVR